MKRGEVISIPIGIFNYLDDDFDVEVTLHNTDQELEFVQMANEVDAPSEYTDFFLLIFYFKIQSEIPNEILMESLLFFF